MIVDSIPYAYTRNGKPFKQNELSNNEFVTTLDSSNNYGRYKFRDDRKDFDGIYAKPIVGYEPESQLWDGLDKKEKSGMTLITKNTEIKKEIKDKKTGEPLPIKGVKFCQEVDYKLSQGEEQYCSEPTNEKGITWLEIDKMAYGKSTLVEKFDEKVFKIDPDTKQKTETEVKQAGDPVKIYVDLGTRFLGETSGNELITYQGLVEQIEGKPLEEINKINFMQRKVGKFIENLGNDKNTGGKWLKIYDIRKNKVMYIAKKPVTHCVSWDKLFNAGLVYGLDQLDLSTFKPNSSDTITTIKANKNYNGNPYTAKAIKIKDRWFIIRLLKTTNNKNSIINTNITNTEIYGSEWNRYILPLIKENRYEDTVKDIIEGALKHTKDEDFTIQLSNYKYNGDLTVGTKEKIETLHDSMTGINTITQELIANQVLGRGGFSTFGEKIRAAIKVTYPSGIQGSNDVNGFRPVLEEIPQNCYDGACFEGEVAGTDFITYKELIHEITGKPLNEIKDGKDTGGIGNKLPIGNNEIPYKQADDRPTGGNWLKIYDAKKDKTLYIAKKPLTNEVTWEDLFKKGVVYGLDVLDKTGTPIEGKLSEIKSQYEAGLTIKNYKGKIVEIKGKKYLVRLLKAYNDSKNNGDPNNVIKFWYQGTDVLKGSEWNRYIIPLVKEYRYDAKHMLEEELKEKLDRNNPENKYNIQLASYNWFGDFLISANTNNWGRNYKQYKGKPIYIERSNGSSTITQEYSGSYDISHNPSKYFRSKRGMESSNTGSAADSQQLMPAGADASVYTDTGFRPVLEEIPE